MTKPKITYQKQENWHCKLYSEPACAALCNVRSCIKRVMLLIHSVPTLPSVSRSIDVPLWYMHTAVFKHAPSILNVPWKNMWWWSRPDCFAWFADQTNGCILLLSFSIENNYMYIEKISSLAVIGTKWSPYYYDFSHTYLESFQFLKEVGSKPIGRWRGHKGRVLSRPISRRHFSWWWWVASGDEQLSIIIDDHHMELCMFQMIRKQTKYYY